MVAVVPGTGLGLLNTSLIESRFVSGGGSESTAEWHGGDGFEAGFPAASDAVAWVLKLRDWLHVVKHETTLIGGRAEVAAPVGNAQPTGRESLADSFRLGAALGPRAPDGPALTSPTTWEPL
jgi:hypothetical protein